MNRIRMAALGAAVVLGFGAQAHAQQTQPGQKSRAERGAEGRHRAGKRLFRGIELTETQKTQVQSIGAKYREQRQALFPRNQGAQRPDSAARAQRRTQLQQLAQREQAELRAVLTTAQQTQFDKNVAELRERVGQRGVRGARGADRRDRAKRGERAAAVRGGRGAGAVLRGIELTEAQKTQLQTLRTKQREERQALVKQLRADGQRPDSAERAQVRQLAERQRTQVRALLTPAQQQQFDKNVAELKQRAGERGARRGRARRA